MYIQFIIVFRQQKKPTRSCFLYFWKPQRETWITVRTLSLINECLYELKRDVCGGVLSRLKNSLEVGHQVSRHGNWVPHSSKSACLAWVVLKIRTRGYSSSSKLFKCKGRDRQLLLYNTSSDWIRLSFSGVETKARLQHPTSEMEYPSIQFFILLNYESETK